LAFSHSFADKKEINLYEKQFSKLANFLFLRPWEAGKAAMRGGFSICYFPFFCYFSQCTLFAKIVFASTTRVLFL